MSREEATAKCEEHGDARGDADGDRGEDIDRAVTQLTLRNLLVEPTAGCNGRL